jgi:subtilisin
MSTTKRFVVLPAYGFQNAVLLNPKLSGPTVKLAARPGSRGSPRAATAMTVLHSTHENGPKLVEMTDEAELNLRAEVPGLKVVPVVEYKKLRAEYHVDQRPSVKTVKAATGLQVIIVDKETSQPVRGARVIAFTNFQAREGDEGVSGKDGAVSLRLKPGTKLERLYVYGPPGFWGRLAINTTAKRTDTLELTPINLQDEATLLPGFYKRLPLDAGNGIKVAVIDSGVAQQHPALPNASGGVNLVYDETHDDAGASSEWGPAKKDGDHGTHVAGIIGARPAGNSKVRGVAPGIELRSYRVFPNSGGGATNYDIMNAIDRAVLDGCHIVNLSLGGGDEDEAVRAAIGKALDKGVLVVAAAGNDGRRAVSFPAALPSCVSVSAMGRKGTFPKGSTEEADMAKPYGNPDNDFFVAAFSNIGPQIDVTGPGVGVVSTLPEDGYGVMSGTSMAAPAVAGMAAYLLASTPPILRANKSERVQLLKEALYTSCRRLGFGRDYEGFGLPSSA